MTKAKGWATKTNGSKSAPEEKDHAREQARAQYESIVEMVDAVDLTDGPEAIDRIQEDPLSVEVRSAWTVVGDKLEAAEYRIVLCTGGPHVQITGDLNQNNEPCSATLEYQDWGTPMTEYSEADQDVLIQYASHFYFGG